ncbi:glycosyltransferase [Endozoicomonas gorgoniicola]|uniref:Glycosyltransferase n=1 Tax=Endozoicomonas gorgoniicola TaxID=1234144 RepID=A0ABT3MPS9_9GAMM|nr:glycosyltransferase [Endozoicomonas gorgoniicola]MCW7551380.1 glycosyltransferase [Endozoicomonas gorgoniicola]
MKLITVNSNKSTTIGGVEGLIRFIQSLDIDYKMIELFFSIGTKEVYQENKNIDYIDYSIKNHSGLLSKLGLKINQIRKIKSCSAGDGAVIILFHPNDLLYMPVSILKSSKIILVQTNRFDIFFKPFSKIIMALVKKYINYVTVYTKKDKAVLTEMYPDLGKKIKVIPRGCRIQSCETVRTCSKKLVTVARIDEDQKDFTAMLDIFSRLPKGYSLDIYGGGSAEEIASLQEKVGKVPGVQFKGEVSDDLPKVLQQYSVFLMTSRYEGFGQTLIEARSQGLPIVVFDNFDALSFIVENGFNGFAIQNNDRHEFSRKILELCENEHIYMNMTRNALSKAQETNLDLVNSLWKEIL